MDVGESINPAIDIGQIEGAFAQGYGLFMLEQMVHSPDGALWTKGFTYCFTTFYLIRNYVVCGCKNA